MPTPDQNPDEFAVMVTDEAHTTVIQPVILFSKQNLVRDAFQEARGGWSDILELHCAHCDEYLMTYQKDGPGPLKRCYLDRIHHPDELKALKDQEFDVEKFANLECTKCHAEIGKPMLYEKHEDERDESRPAFNMAENQAYFYTFKFKT